MFAIGEFARHGRVPVRMLRHYDAIGLLEPGSITPVIQPLCHELPRRLCSAGVAITGPPLACYSDADGDTGAIEIHAALPITSEPAGQYDFRVVSPPEVPAAATLIHHGSMDHVLPSIQALARWIDANGYRSLGYARELTLEFSGDRDQWATELQEPITTSQENQWTSQQRSPSEPRSRTSPFPPG